MILTLLHPGVSFALETAVNRIRTHFQKLLHYTLLEITESRGLSVEKSRNFTKRARNGLYEVGDVSLRYVDRVYKHTKFIGRAWTRSDTKTETFFFKCLSFPSAC